MLLASSSDGVSDEELDDIEAQIGCKLPDDYRCSYRIHNGQKLVIPGSEFTQSPSPSSVSPSHSNQSVCGSPG